MTDNNDFNEPQSTNQAPFEPPIAPNPQPQQPYTYGQQPNVPPPYYGAQPPMPPKQPPFGYPPYGNFYPQYTAPQKKPIPTGLKVFIFIMSFIAVGTVLGFFIFGAVKGMTAVESKTQPDYSDYFDFDFGEGDTYPNQPYFDEDESKEKSEPEVYEQPDITVVPNTDGITINKLPTGAELSAEEVYNKVEPSTVTVSAKIPMGDGTYGDSVGTGMFITADGFIITNSHVVGSIKSSIVTITTNDNQEHPAVVVGCDKTTDLAVLKIDGSGYIPAELGEANDLSIGEWVIAIGNPGGTSFSGSLTRGVISGLDRTVGSYSSNGMTYIQTDAAINPGNSGGPLVNMYGQVVGINSSKIVAQYYEGMGFAIPVSKAKPIIDELLATGYVNGRTRLGITGQNVFYGSPQGVTIVAIDSESSFSGTEAKVDDIITAIGDKTVTDLTSLANEMLAYSPGDTAEVTLYRPSTKSEIKVTITLLEDKGETQK